MTVGQWNNFVSRTVNKKKINTGTPVLITLADPVTCGNASTGIKGIRFGSELEGSSKIILEPQSRLYQSNFRTDFPCGWEITTRKGKRVFLCSRCGHSVDVSDKFCRNCGQRLQ